MAARNSFVVTGGARGIARAIAERLAVDAEVVVLDVVEHLDWEHERVALISGDACDVDVAARAAQLAESAGPLAGWVNNAAVFRDASPRLGSST